MQAKTKSIPDEALAGWVRKRAPSAERAEFIRSLKFLCDDPGDKAEVELIAEFLLDLRVRARGGRREIYGSRHWEEPAFVWVHPDWCALDPDHEGRCHTEECGYKQSHDGLCWSVQTWPRRVSHLAQG